MGIGILGGNKSSSTQTYYTTTQTTSTAQELGGVGNTAISYGTGVTVEGLSDANLSRVLDTVDNTVNNAVGSVQSAGDKALILASNTADALSQNAAEAMRQTAEAWGQARSETKQVLQDLQPYAIGIFVIALAAIAVMGVKKK